MSCLSLKVYLLLDWVDPWLARDLADAAARNPATTWCVTVTDQHGHAIGHGCARPEPSAETRRTRQPGGPGFTFTPTAERGTWRLRVPGSGPDLLVSFDPVTTRSAITVSKPGGMIPGSGCGT